MVLEIPSGGVEALDRSVLDAARRELLEETGYGGGEFVETAQLSPNPANHTNTVHCFLATGVKQISKPVDDETEKIEIVTLPVQEVIKLLRSNDVFQALHTSSLFFALDKLGKINFNE